MAWMNERELSRRRRNPLKYAHPKLRCSNCNATYSKHWLMFISNQGNGLDKPPQYCPECGFFHGGKFGGASDD